MCACEQMIMEKMKKFCKRDIRDIALTQELLIYIGSFMRSHPSLFDGSLRLRVGFIIDAMMHELEQERLSLSHAYDNYLYEHLMALSPIQMKSAPPQPHHYHQSLKKFWGPNQSCSSECSCTRTMSTNPSMRMTTSFSNPWRLPPPSNTSTCWLLGLF